VPVSHIRPTKKPIKKKGEKMTDLVCATCMVEFETIKGLRGHCRYGECTNKFAPLFKQMGISDGRTCPICSKKFLSTQNVIKHIQAEHEDKIQNMDKQVDNATIHVERQSGDVSVKPLDQPHNFVTNPLDEKPVAAQAQLAAFPQQQQQQQFLKPMIPLHFYFPQYRYLAHLAPFCTLSFLDTLNVRTLIRNWCGKSDWIIVESCENTMFLLWQNGWLLYYNRCV
jgi:hypothetical protein